MRGGEQVHKEVEVIEDRLANHDQQSLHLAGLSDLDECHQMHPLIIRFFQQFADPTLIFADVTDRF